MVGRQTVDRRGKTRGAGGTPFWTAVSLLLGSARQRAAGRRKRQRELTRQRTGKAAGGSGWEPLATLLAAVLGLVISGAAAYVLSGAVDGGDKIEAERHGKIVVSTFFKKSVDEAVAAPTPAEATGPDYALEAKWRVGFRSGLNEDALERKRAAEETRLRAAVRAHGSADLVDEDVAAPGLGAPHGAHSVAAVLGSLVLLWWGLTLVFQGEGMELDLQRRRHPMWEWLYSHPVPTGAIFAAEMLSPLAANPTYWGVPVFVWIAYGSVYGAGLGFVAAVGIGLPLTTAAACLGKALEIGIMIRFAPRSRGALIGLMSWFGYASLMLFFLGAVSISRVTAAVGPLLAPLAALPWPFLGWFLGQRADGSFSFVAGLLTCWALAGLTGVAAVRFCVWGAQRGLSGNHGRADTLAPRKGKEATVRFGTEPLYRKEFLWFVRDRSAIVQTILIPLTVAGFQMFNLRGAIQSAQGSWNYLCGAAILFGTYFLWVLGPKSLASEGAALWLALTWPRGLESLLKAKAWLWSLISTGIVALVMGYAIFLFPAEWWKVGLVGAGWLVFGRSMAEKTVTLVSVTSSSGEPEPLPRSRKWAASLGMLTFAIGVITQQWQLAVTGIVYSYITAAAMWESFRARLPFLYDPWSETLPPAPTLMHAMVAVALLVEVGAVGSGIIIAVAGRDFLPVARAVSYALCALVVSWATANFLGSRGVRGRDVWCWPRGIGNADGEWWRGKAGWARALATGIGGGAALGCCARGYVVILTWFPTLAGPIRAAQQQMADNPGLKWSYAFCAVLVAPVAEEYLFRGLLYRALDREWGGWRAVVGSAAFFAIYHPPAAWVPVGLLGAANAVLFKRTGRLAPAVALHMVYNAVVVA